MKRCFLLTIILEKAKSEGYFIKCIFVLMIDASVNVARVAARVALGGHNVEEDKIRSRYEKSLGNIGRLLEICDILHVYDNTEEPFYRSLCFLIMSENDIGSGMEKMVER